MKEKQMYKNSSVFVLSLDDSVYKLETDASLQQSLCKLFSKQTKGTVNGKVLVGFDGNYKPNEDEIFIIRNFKLLDAIMDAVRNPIGVQEFKKVKGKYPEIKALFIGEKQESDNKEEFDISFQKIRKEQIVSKNNLNLILDNNTFIENKRFSFGVSDSIDCYYSKGDLYFSSYFFARQIFELRDYYRTATDSDVEDFINLSEIGIINMDTFKAQAQSSWVRRKIAAINDSKILENNSANDIKKVADETGINLEISGEQIVIPEDKDSVKILLGFLDEEAYRGPFSNTTYLAGSKRKI